jgi:hypothetical protein
MPHPTASPDPGSQAQAANTTTGPDRATEAATALTRPFTLARQLLPDNPVPVALGAGALAVAGVID